MQRVRDKFSHIWECNVKVDFAREGFDRINVAQGKD
jgi:hypothetical protein